MGRRTAGWGLGALLAAGCGAPAVDEYAEQLELAYCQWEAECHRFAAVADCQAARADERDPQLAYMSAAVAAGTALYDGEAALACLEAIRGLGCGAQYPETPAVCREVFRGKIGRNGPCMSAFECVGEAICGFDPACTDACCPGACRVLPEPLEEGEACGGTRACADGLFCGFDEVTGMATACAPRVKAGERCSSDAGCVEAAYCDDGKCRMRPVRGIGQACDLNDVCEAPGQCHYLSIDGVEQARCVAPGGLGAPCNASDSGTCARFDTFCDETTNSCELLPGPGAGCSPGGCADHAFCVRADGDEVGTCTALARAGEACGEVAGVYVQCLGDLQCDMFSRCALPPPSERADCPVPGAE